MVPSILDALDPSQMWAHSSGRLNLLCLMWLWCTCKWTSQGVLSGTAFYHHNMKNMQVGKVHRIVFLNLKGSTIIQISCVHNMLACFLWCSIFHPLIFVCLGDCAKQTWVGQSISKVNFVSCITWHIGLGSFLESIEADFVKNLKIQTDK